MRIRDQRQSSAAAGYRATKRLKRIPTVRWSDLVRPYVLIIAKKLSAGSGSRQILIASPRLCGFALRRPQV
jgi:hypothetical protein